MSLSAGERWEQVASLSAGELAQVPYPLLLLALSRAGRSAVLELHRRPVEKRVFFVDGVPVDCRSNLVHETFGRFLVGAGKLGEEDFRTALHDSLARELPLGEVLLERGLMEPGELYRQLQQCLARKLLDGFTWKEGSFQIAEEVAEVDSTLKVRVPQLILTGVLKLTPLEEVTRAIRPLFPETLARNPAPPFAEEELQLRGPTADVMAALAGKPLRMDELFVKLPQLPPNELGRVLYALQLLELVVPASRLGARSAAAAAAPAATTATAATAGSVAPAASAAPAPPPAVAPVAPAVAAAPAAAATAAEDLATRRIARSAAGLSPDEIEQTKNRILQAYLSYRRKDAFDLLGLADGATVEQIDQQWLRCAQAWAPWPLEGSAPADLLEKARELFLAGSEAYGELRDGEKRNLLLERRVRARKDRERERGRGSMAIQTDLLDPEAQFQKGMELLRAGQDRKALELLQYAADLDAQNAVYRSEAAWCRYRVLGSAGKVLEELDEAVRADPRCGLAWYYRGMVQGKEGRFAEGEESLRRAVKLMSPDRRPIEALKELTAASKKR